MEPGTRDCQLSISCFALFPYTLPLTQYKNLRATRVSRETSVNVLLLLKVSKKPLRNNSAEARSFWGQEHILSLTFGIMYNGNGPPARTAGGGFSDEKLKIIIQGSQEA